MSPSSILIIGGGIQGVCTAYYLTQLAKERGRNISVTILEGSGIAAGASGKAGGLLALDWHGQSPMHPDSRCRPGEPHTKEELTTDLLVTSTECTAGASTSSLASLSYKLHRELAEKYSGDTTWGYRTLDTLSVSADLTRTQKRRQNGSSSDLTEEKGFFGWLNKDALGETSVLGTKESTAQVHPRLFTQRIAEIAQQERGFRIVYGTATSLERNVEASSFIVKALPTQQEGSAATEDSDKEMTLDGVDGLVITAGPWTGSLLTQLGIKAGGRARRIEGSRAHSVVLRTAESRVLPAQALFTSIKEKKSWSEPEIYNRPDGTAYACGPTDDSPLPSLASEVQVDRSATAMIIKQVAGLAPDYLSVHEGPHSAQIEAEQACYLPVGSGDPVIGKLEENIWVGAGHSCWGITNGPATGKCLAELILDGRASSANISRLGP